ncbi:MAG: ATP-binding protein [Eggerthellaceae bacterium]|nr:ATP-binding protein [Eggerthellaceae bacterium]
MNIDVGSCSSGEKSIFALCEKLSRKTFEGGGDLCIDFSSSRFVMVGHVVACVAIGKYARFSGVNATARFSTNTDVFRYLQRVNFLDFVKADIREDFCRHAPNGRFLEVTKVSEDNATDVAQELRSVVSGSTGVNESVASALDYSFGEIVDNVINHSKTEVDALVAAQYYPSHRYVEFCVADCGIGIASSLSNNPDYASLSGQELLIKAFDEGVGERVGANFDGSPGSGLGHGLAFLARLIEASGGTAWVVSQENAAIICGGSREGVEGLYFPGTIICARIPSDVAIKESDLRPNGADRSYYWDAQGNDSVDDIDIDDILW